MERNRRAEDPRPRQTVWDDFADNVHNGLAVLGMILMGVFVVWCLILAFAPS